MRVLTDCAEFSSLLCDYQDGTLTGDEHASADQHLKACTACRETLAQVQAIKTLLDGTLQEHVMRDKFNAETDQKLRSITADPQLEVDPVEERLVAAEPVGFFGGASDRFGAAPWWAVSVSVHVLAILLASLVTMTIGEVLDDGEIIIVTNIEKSPMLQAEEEKKRALDVLDSKVDVPPTDPTSTEQSNIVVPPDILAKAEVGDHFETINLDRPDTQSAFGNPEARMFHSVHGNDEPEGGGGAGGLSLMDEMIGVGGAASPGSGGGWGGGNGTGTGIGTGSGHGSFGNRNGGGRKLMVMRHGGTKATESAVDKSLEWLARHQEADGHWDSLKLEARNDPRCTGVNGDAANTGFALLAFLGAGHTEKVGRYKSHVKRATEWLCKTLEVQEKTCGTGRFVNGHGGNYTQGIASLALAESAAMGRNPEVKKWAQKAMDGVIAGQIKIGESEYHAWDYNPRGHTNDTSVTGWNIMALKSGKIAGLHIDPASLEGAMKWINSGQDLKGAPKGAGEAEYWEGGMMTYRGKVGQEPQPKNMAMTAAAALTRLFVGGEKPSDAGVAGPCNLMKKAANLPTADQARFNLYYWYYGTLVMFQKGGDHWKEWNEAMKKALLETQRKDGDFEGSWNPYKGVGQGLIYGGRVMATALGALNLEVYYRYMPILR